MNSRLLHRRCSAIGRGRRRSLGFTLIELLTAITIAVILLAIAAPSFQQFQRNSQLTASVNTLVAALGAARAEAMKRQLDVYVTPTSGNWAQGWRVWVDPALNQSQSTAIDVLIQAPVPSTVSVTTGANFGTDATLGTYIKFNGAGFPQQINNAPLQQTQQLVFTNGTESRFVLVSANGRIRACKTTDPACSLSSEW